MLKRGIVIPEKLPSPEAMEFATSLEPAGFDIAWLTEIARDPFTRAATILDRTTRLVVGTAVALWTRSPVTSAMTAAELHELSGGRFIYGVGTGTAEASAAIHNIPWDKPARQMSEYLRVVRGAWDAQDGRTLTLDGDYHPVRGFSQPFHRGAPKLMMAAVQKGMLRVAARQADGVLFNPASTVQYIENYAIPTLTSAAEAAGRSAEDIERFVTLRCAVHEDRDRARHWARLSICEYGRFPVHQRVYEMNGFGAEAEIIASAMSNGERDHALGAVTDAMVDAFSVSGTPDDVRAQLRSWEGLVHGVALTSPSFELTVDELRENCAAIRDAFSIPPAEGGGAG